MRLPLSVLVALLLLTPTAVHAQAEQQFTVTPVSPLLQPDRPEPLTSELYPTYRKEGGLLGALIIGLAAAFIAHKICDDGESFQEEGERCTGETVGFGMAGVVGGYLLGSLIGGKIEKAPPHAN